MAHAGSQLVSAWVSDELAAVIDSVAALANVDRSTLIRHSLAATLVGIAAEVNQAETGPPAVPLADGLRPDAG